MCNADLSFPMFDYLYWKSHAIIFESLFSFIVDMPRIFTLGFFEEKDNQHWTL